MSDNKNNKNKEYMFHQEEGGTIRISEDVVATIAGGAAAEVEGVSGLMSGKGASKGVRLSTRDEQVILDLYLSVKYGSVIPEVAEKVQKAVASAVEASTGFAIHEVNIHVGGLSFE